MGMISVLIILNDNLHSLKRDERFGQRVYEDVSAFPRPRKEWESLGQYGRVVSVGHSSYEQIVSVTGNTGAPLPADEHEALVKYRRSRDRKAKRAAREKDGA
jgi:hypothetical protein